MNRSGSKSRNRIVWSGVLIPLMSALVGCQPEGVGHADHSVQPTTLEPSKTPAEAEPSKTTKIPMH